MRRSSGFLNNTFSVKTQFGPACGRNTDICSYSTHFYFLLDYEALIAGMPEGGGGGGGGGI